MKPHALTLVATIIFALMAYFGFSPNLDAADTIAQQAQEIRDAFAARNIILGLTGAVGLGSYIWDTFFKKRDDGGSR